MKPKTINECITGSWFKYKRFHELPTVFYSVKNIEDGILILNHVKDDKVMTKETFDPKVFDQRFPRVKGYPSIEWG